MTRSKGLTLDAFMEKGSGTKEFIEEILPEPPEGWKWIILNEIMDLSNGKFITKKEMSDEGKYPVYGSNGIIGRTNKYLIKEDTIVIGRVGACGAVNIARAPA